MTEKICANCIHYGLWSICELDGEYTGEEWYCELFERDDEKINDLSEDIYD